jgi:hypothetical protein
MAGYAALITDTSLHGSATLQMTWGADGVLIDTLSWERGTDGHSRRSHSLARLSLKDARRLRVLLGEAIAVAELSAIDQPSLPHLRRAA